MCHYLDGENSALSSNLSPTKKRKEKRIKEKKTKLGFVTISFLKELWDGIMQYSPQ
jgi:hypothetical protein